MKNVEKYQRQYFMPPVVTYDWVKKEYIDKAPIWCSVDLRDGNQALVEPMGLEEKVEYFKMLVKVGFKEIEVGFPAASDTEYAFMRALIERNMIPEDVTVQVLTQAREHIIKKTFEAVAGAPHAVIHLYNSTSVAQRKQVFKKSKKEIKELAVYGAKTIRDLAKITEGNFTFEYSPESFHGTEVDYAMDVCNAVLDEWQPTPDHKAIINLPTTVESSMPHVFASQIEYFHKNMKYRDGVILSIHPHNDRGCGVATAEFGVIAGADRVEGSLFGNGERTGNLDVVTMAMNMYAQGVEPELDFSTMPEIVKEYEALTGMKVDPRQPYAGELVFTAFSGSHQDAIAKGTAWREAGKGEKWDTPYLPIDPRDVGRQYDSDVIRINSQSGKGGVSYVLKQNYGVSIPMDMREEVGYAIKGVSDREHKELSPARIYEIFENRYMIYMPHFNVTECHFVQENGMQAHITIHQDGRKSTVTAGGNGRLDAVSNGISQYFQMGYELKVYEEHSLSTGSTSKAVTYVGISYQDKMFWGVGMDEDIIKSTIHALVVAVNKAMEEKENSQGMPERMVEITNYMESNYATVTLEDLAGKFFLSAPYVSKYIKKYTNQTFEENLKRIRMQKAKALLKSTNAKVETISAKVGYENVEHFIRLFKKTFGVTPNKYRD